LAQSCVEKKSTESILDTDVASRALDTNIFDSLKSVKIVGRRGHIQGAFTIKELRELTKLEGNLKFGVRESELIQGDVILERPKKRIDKLLRDYAQKLKLKLKQKQPCDDDDITIELRFFMNPVEFITEEGQVTAVKFEKTVLENNRAIGTGEFETLEADLVLVSVGYKSNCLAGLEESFCEDSGTVMSVRGRVRVGEGEGGGGGRGNDFLYCSGWVKRGPVGIIGSNISDARETADSLVSDFLENKFGGKEGKIEKLLADKGVEWVGWEEWEKIDNFEQANENKRTELQPREKITSVDKMLNVVND